MLDTIDIDRCVWDADYRLQVKRMLKCEVRPLLSAANENDPEADQPPSGDTTTRH